MNPFSLKCQTHTKIPVHFYSYELNSNKCAIIDFTERMTKRLPKPMKKVFAGMTEDVRYRTVLPGFDRRKRAGSFRKIGENFSFIQKGTYFARLILRT
jgi:hypothetical protein